MLQGLNVGESPPTNADICFVLFWGCFFFHSCLFLSLQDQTICRGLPAGHGVLGLNRRHRGEERWSQT